jgi:hypothetical protein
MFTGSIRRRVVLCVLALACLTASASGGPIGPGNLVVVQVDNTTGVTLREFTTAGADVQSIIVPATGANALTMSFTATSEGSLTLSPNGAFLGFAGYRTGTNGSGTDRVIGRVDAATGTVDTSTTIPVGEGYVGNNIRGAVWDGNQYWSSGTGSSSSGGTRTGTFGSTSGSVQVSSTVTNTRVVNIFNGQLYTSTMSGAFRGVNTVGTGLPTTSGQTTTLLPGFDPATGSPQSAYAFFFTDANTLYVADDRVSGVGGIQKWTFDGTDWNFQYSTLLATSGDAGAGARGLYVSGGVIYATSSEPGSTTGTGNRIVSLTDTGTSFSSVTTLVTAGTNTVFRGIVVAVPEPGSLLLCGLAGVGFAGAAIRRYRKRAATA